MSSVVFPGCNLKKYNKGKGWILILQSNFTELFKIEKGMAFVNHHKITVKKYNTEGIMNQESNIFCIYFLLNTHTEIKHHYNGD